MSQSLRTGYNASRMTTWRDLLIQGRKELTGVSGSAALDAELLLAHAAGCTRTDVISHGDEDAPEGLSCGYAELLARRKTHLPVAYITGTKEFWGLTFRVTPAVLVPRPETELLVEEGLIEAESGRGDLMIADVGTGSGCIAIALGRELQRRGRVFDIYALDSSAAALAVARENTAAHGLEGKIQFIESDLFAALPPQPVFDLILSNPPYIPVGSQSAAPELVHEPAAALYAGADGLAVIRGLILEAPRRLRRGGCLLCEIGAGQGLLMRMLLDEIGVAASFEEPELLPDLAGIDRVLRLRRR